MASQEIEQVYRIVDQSLSIHAILRDKYARLSLYVESLLLVSSVAMVSQVLLDPQVLSLVGWQSKLTVPVLRIASVLSLTCSIVLLKVDWKGKSFTYRQSTEKLAAMKLRLRALRYAQSADAPAELAALKDARALLTSLPEIPEAQFVKLKAAHKRKVELSKLVDRFPRAPVWMLRARLLLSGIRSVLKVSDS